jgi:hypothetical protein
VRRRRDDLGDHVAGAQHDHLVALAQILAREVLLVVERRQLHGHAADATGSSSAKGCRSPNLPTFQCTASSRVLAVVGGNFQATAQRGSRPDRAEPALQLEVGDLDDDAVDLEVERPAAALPLEALRDDRLLVVEHDDLVLTGSRARAATERLPLVVSSSPRRRRR